MTSGAGLKRLSGDTILGCFGFGSVPSSGAGRRAGLVIAVLLGAILLAAPPSDALETAVEALLLKMDELMRGDSSEGRMTMTVKTSRYQRSVTMEMRSEGTDKSLIRVLAPPREAGVATLKVDNNIWNYLPKVDRTIKVPASMMSASWMGSHFTNDDLVQESRYQDDYDCVLSDESDSELWVINCVPHQDAPIVWGRVSLSMRRSDELPTEARFFDEDGELVRTMLYDQVRELSGRRIPTRMRVVPADKPEEFTEMNYEEMRFDVEHPAQTFSLRSLRK